MAGEGLIAGLAEPGGVSELNRGAHAGDYWLLYHVFAQGIQSRKTADELSQSLRAKSSNSGWTGEQIVALGQSRAFRELMGSAKMNYVRGWFAACQSFAQQNGGKMPETLLDQFWGGVSGNGGAAGGEAI